MNKLFLFFYLLSFFLNLAVAQKDFTSVNISIKDGLSSNSISDILQDRYGYIWIATADGLNRYDGYNVEIFKNVAADSSSLPYNGLYRMLEDSQGTLWISSTNSFSKYDRNSNSFKSYDQTDSDLPMANRSIHIFEDSRNNLWVSTSDGSLIFDRERETFTRFEVMRTDNSVVYFGGFGGAFAESNGTLYCISQAYGLLKFDYDARLFVQVNLKDNYNDVIKHQVYYDFIADSANNLWIGATNGLYKINLDNNQGFDLSPYNKQNRRTDENAVTGLFLDENNNVWIGTMANGLYIYDSQNQRFSLMFPPSSHGFYSGFFKDNSGILWYGTSRGVFKNDFDKKPFVTYSLPVDNSNINKSVLSFASSSLGKNSIWLGSSQGLYIFNSENNDLKKASSYSKGLQQTDQREITSLLEKSDGTLWIATTPEGLYSYNIKSTNLKNFKSQIYNNTSIMNNQIHALALDKEENIWVGTRQGLSILRKNAAHFELVPSFLNRTYNPQLLSTLEHLKKNTTAVSSIIEVGDFADQSKDFVLRKDTKALMYSVGEGLPEWGMVDFGWLETSDGDTLWSAANVLESFHASGTTKNRLMIGILDLKAGRYKIRYKSDDSHSVQSYNALPPKDSLNWGTQLLSLNDEQFTILSKLLESSEQKTYIEDDDIQVVFCDSKNNIWVGTSNGLASIDSSLLIKNYLSDQKTPGRISNNAIRDINEDFHGNIWIATANGLNRYNHQTKKFDVFSEKDGLPSSNLSAIEVDNTGDIWVSGLKGISKVELGENGELQVIVNYDVKDGLQGYEFIRNASYKDAHGKLYFSGNDGFNAFYPGSSNRTPPFLAFQDILISNKSAIDVMDLSSDLNHISNLSLAHDQNDLSFEFASIHFSRPDKNRVRYQLQGFDEDWILSDRRFASYTNLSPGDYTFKFIGSNGDGVWSDETRLISVHIAAPWYNNWAAYGVYALIFVGLLLTVRRVEMARQQKNATIRESKLRAETAELKAQAAEAEAKMVQAENERKTRELEEARTLQLSMLPKELPQLPNLDIAVYMQTATEVGGDYYDFYVGMDGALTVVIGDATGHGMRAGTMVTAAKSLFNSYAPNPDILFSFQEITRCIRQMNFGKMSMCMTMLKIKGNKLQMSTAGMPPSFIFRRDTRVTEEHLFKAMPLGTMDNFPYEVKETTLNKGDTILLMSDGLPELKNKKGTMYGYQKVRNVFEDIAEKSPEDIVSHLKNEGAGWVDNADPDDDVTFVVIKVK